MPCKIKFHWDSEAAVWTATSDDVPGLVLESGSFDALVERVKAAVPELIHLNGKVSRTQGTVLCVDFHNQVKIINTENRPLCWEREN